MEFNNHILIQFGHFDKLPTQETTLTLPCAFTGVNSCILTPQCYSSGGFGALHLIYAQTLSTFTFYAHNSWVGTNWIAIGY